MSAARLLDPGRDKPYVESDSPSVIILNMATGDITGQTGIRIDGGVETVQNFGVISGLTYGINCTGEQNEYDIVNAGTVSGSEAVYADAGHSSITNTGTIIGVTSAIETFDGIDLTIRNTGSIDGDILLKNKLTSIHNAGTINGSIQLGDGGGNLFDGRGGGVHGTITGGSGSDTIFAGDDGETIAGGKGHDYIHAAAGADTFILNSASGADWDRIWHFDVGHDTLQLDHTVYTPLKADTLPTFAVATAATSTADHLFYNSDTGYLYYDADGSGTAHAAIPIARLDPGLHLSAADFTVI